MRRDLSDLLVLFDWNGTIVADVDRARASTNQVLAGHELKPLGPDEFTTSFRLPLAGMFADLGVAPDGLAEAEAAWNREMTLSVAPMRQGAVDTLTWLREGGARLGVISAAEASVLSDLAGFGIGALLDSVITGAEDKVAALTARRAERARAVYVGDTEYDMTSALAAGFVPVGISGGYCAGDRLHAAGAVVVIDELDELPTVIDRLVP
jgi:phosphoglycolate phosphatase